MVFLISLALAVAFALLCDKAIKKHPYIFYIGTAVIVVFFAIFDFADVRGFAKDYILAIFQKGAFATALFVIVMFTGALKNGSYLIKKLMPIRADLSIMASILILIHNITYGKTYFVRLFTAAGSMQTTQLIAAILSVIMLVIMIPLAVMSFKPIRKKMNGKLWKKIQRSAYVFYGLIYIHVMLINLPMAQRGNWTYIVNIILYSIVFIGYAVMRVRKAVLKRQKNSANAVNISLGSAGIVVMAAVCAMVFVPYAQNINSARESVTYAVPSEKDNTTEVSDTSEESIEESIIEESSVQSEVIDESTVESSIQEQSKEISDTSEVSQSSEESSEQSKVETQTSEQSSQQVSETTEESQSSNAETSKVTQQSSAVTSSKPSTSSQPSTTSKPSTSSQPTTSTPSQSSKVEESSKPESSVVVEPSEEPVKTVYKDGTYTAKRYGYDGYVYATVVIENDKIISVTAYSEESDLWYFEQANESVTSAIIAQQSTDVDAVSGATYSSEAIMGAVADAMKKAKN